MTELIDLLNPRERLRVLFVEFKDELKNEHIKKEKRLEQIFIENRKRIEYYHEQIRYKYEYIFDEIEKNLNDDSYSPIAQMFEGFLRSQNKALYSEVFEKAIPVIKSIERGGGKESIDVNIKTTELYEDKPYNFHMCKLCDKNYNYCWWEDDEEENNYAYKVVRYWKDKSEKEKEEKEDRDRWWYSLEIPNKPITEEILEHYKNIKSDIQDFTKE